MAQVSWPPLSFVQQRMLDSASGFNYWINQVIQSLNYPVAALTNAGVQTGDNTAFQFGSGNLFLSNASVDFLTSSGCGTYPLGQVYSVKGHNQSLITPSEYSGPTLTMIKITLGWGGPVMFSDTESPKAALLDAIIATFNAQEYYGLLDGTGVVYNNQIAYEFEEPVKQEGNVQFRQSSYFALTHNVITGFNG